MQIDTHCDLLHLASASRRHWNALSHVLYRDMSLVITAKDLVSDQSLGQYRSCLNLNLQDCVKTLRCIRKSASAINTAAISLDEAFPQLQELIIDLPWDMFTPSLLYAVSPKDQPTHPLRVLKTPVGLPEDCYVLGHALSQLPNLKSLTITDVPDEEDFLNEAIPFLSRWIRQRASSLIHLDITLTDPNRPRSREIDRFAVPHELDYHFNIFFPAPSDRELVESRQALAWAGNDAPLYRKPLFELESLRLKYFGIHADSFNHYNNLRKIKNLSLPHCAVHPKVWVELARLAQLVSLLEIDYSLLTSSGDNDNPLLTFLGTQSSLEALTFAIPLPRYEYTGFFLLDETKVYSIQEVAGIEVEHSRSLTMRDFAQSALVRMVNLEHLRLPKGMFSRMQRI